jgi:hypothetical protein
MRCQWRAASSIFGGDASSLPTWFQPEPLAIAGNVLRLPARYLATLQIVVEHAPSER